MKKGGEFTKDPTLKAAKEIECALLNKKLKSENGFLSNLKKNITKFQKRLDDFEAKFKSYRSTLN